MSTPEEIKAKTDQVKLLLTDGIRFAGLTRETFKAGIDELAELDKQLRNLNNPDYERYYIHPEYIQARRDDFILWGDLPQSDWESVLEGIAKLQQIIAEATE